MSGFYRPPPPKSASKASASTVCQKCLKRDNYECKSNTQERPYIARPSRTQQLLNPKLAPQLTSDVPNDLLRKKGLADEVLSKFVSDKLTEDKPHASRSNRRASRSERSSSVSTISTNASPSPPPAISQRSTFQITEDDDNYYPLPSSPRRNDHRENLKRRRSPSYVSDESAFERDRNTRRRQNSSSPRGERGRGRRRSRSMGSRRSRSATPRRRASPKSLNSEGKTPTATRYKSPSETTERSQSAVGEQRYTKGERRRDRRHVSGSRSRSRSRSPYGHSKTESYRNRRTSPDRRARDQRNGGQANGRPIPRERSLSPYSKRLALTQSMGRR